MKNIRLVTMLSLAMLGMALTSCTPQKPPAPKIEGVWLYEAPVAKEQVFGGGTVVTERIHLKLTPDGKVSLKWSEGGSEVGFVEGSIQGDWKQEGDLLVMTNPDSSFGVFRIVAVEQAELRVLTRQGKLYRLTRMPD